MSLISILLMVSIIWHNLTYEKFSKNRTLLHNSELLITFDSELQHLDIAEIFFNVLYILRLNIGKLIQTLPQNTNVFIIYDRSNEMFTI